MKKILFLLVLFVWGSVTFAQETPEFKFFKIYGDLNGESVLLETPNPPKLVGVPGIVVEKPGWSGIFLSTDFTLIRN